MVYLNRKDIREPRRYLTRTTCIIAGCLILLIIGLWAYVRSLPLPPQPFIPATQTRINPQDGAEMICIPAGRFLMGSRSVTDQNTKDESPQHRVYLDAYWIYTRPVSVMQYREFCEATHRAMPPKPQGGWRDFHPIVNVTWDDAAAYARWARVALPTEAQWEKAARGTDGRLYPWGNTEKEARRDPEPAKQQQPVKVFNVPDPYADWKEPSQTSMIGCHQDRDSPYGCEDMVGNVFQWCADWYDNTYYKRSPYRNPCGPPKGEWHALRGGSTSAKGETAYRVTDRNLIINYFMNQTIEEIVPEAKILTAGHSKAVPRDDIGFRCAAPE